MFRDGTRARARIWIFAIGLALPAAGWAQSPAPSPEMQRAREFLQKSLSLMKPDLAERAKALPPEIQQFLLRIAVKHTRHSDTLT